MVATFVWPWKNDEELLEVRRLFYPDVQLDEETRRQHQQLAVNIVNTWKLRRSRIPHSLLATADLVDAILHHDTSKNSASTIKAVYASALAKMVTSVCDLEQDSVEKRSMMEQAAKIGMPEDWVQLRHAITHGQTPGLRALEEAVREAVPWMWGHFWRGFDGRDEVGEAELRREIGEGLVEYRRQRRAMIAEKQEASLDMNLAAQTSKDLRRACRKRHDGLDQLIYVLLNDNIILPSEKQTKLKFKALLLVWNDLLLKMAERQPRFQAKFASALVQMFAAWSESSQISTVVPGVGSKWLRHVLLDPKWAAISPSHALEELRCDVAESCLMSKNEYTSVVLKGLLGAMSGDQAETLKQLMEVCDGERSSDSMELNIGNVTDVESVPAERTGWNNPVAVWIPKPIGA